jgi:hypothetical protein
MSDKGRDIPDIEASLEKRPLVEKEIQIKNNKYGRILTPIALLVAVAGAGLLISSVQSNLYQGTVILYIECIHICIQIHSHIQLCT